MLLQSTGGSESHKDRKKISWTLLREKVAWCRGKETSYLREVRKNVMRKNSCGAVETELDLEHPKQND